MAMASWKTLSRGSASSRGCGEPQGHLQTDRLVSLGTALTSIEEVLLDIVENVEPRAARFVADAGTIGAGGALALHHGSYTSRSAREGNMCS